MKTPELKTVRVVAGDNVVVNGSLPDILDDVTGVIDIGAENIGEWLIKEKSAVFVVKSLIDMLKHLSEELPEDKEELLLMGKAFKTSINLAIMISLPNCFDSRNKMLSLKRVLFHLEHAAGIDITPSVN